MNTDEGLFSFDPASGKPLWNHPTAPGNPGVPRSTQPRVVDQHRVLFDAGPDIGTIMLDVRHDYGTWTHEEKWVSYKLKPNFNDFVVHGDAIYGFDTRIMVCIDLNTGEQRWKDGRYGSGQVLLLEDQPVLLVVTDKGEVVLVAADPNKHQELARFKAIEGKTWNHPVIANGHLYVRSAEEIACYRLSNEMTNP